MSRRTCVVIKQAQSNPTIFFRMMKNKKTKDSILYHFYLGIPGGAAVGEEVTPAAVSPTMQEEGRVSSLNRTNPIQSNESNESVQSNDSIQEEPQTPPNGRKKRKAQVHNY